MTERYVIFCDESIKDGSHFSNFFGGVLMSSKHLAYVTRVLEAKKSELQMHGEVKFTKITENYQDKYIELVKTFFALMHEGRIKVTIMFTQNINRAIGLTPEQKRNGYFRLYHQLIRYGFSIQDSPGENPIQLELRFDKFPARNPAIELFKERLEALSVDGDYLKRGVKLRKSDIAEVDSKDHVALQCLDIVLGCIQFRLNDCHKYIEPGKKRRSKRTKAKDAVYKAIYAEIKKLYPDYKFNTGASTTFGATFADRWKMPYRHWLFVPSNYERNPDYVSKKK